MDFCKSTCECCPQRERERESMVSIEVPPHLTITALPHSLSLPNSGALEFTIITWSKRSFCLSHDARTLIYSAYILHVPRLCSRQIHRGPRLLMRHLVQSPGTLAPFPSGSCLRSGRRTLTELIPMSISVNADGGLGGGLPPDEVLCARIVIPAAGTELDVEIWGILKKKKK
jgi:hypothetical protein